MRNLLFKEFKLTSLPLTYIFLLFSLVTFIPGYPISIGAFFLALGIFQSFENARLQNDILFTMLLPVSRREAVLAKYCYVMIIEALFFFLCLTMTVVRMTLLRFSPIYVNNAMMNANLAYLGYILIIFSLFNRIFVGGFFKTAYYTGKPFIYFSILSFLVILVAEILHHIPGLFSLNSQSEGIKEQAIVLIIGIAAYSIATYSAIKDSLRSFEKLDI